jgi:hypothetical protein
MSAKISHDSAHDPIRIVPLYAPENVHPTDTLAVPAVAANLTYRNGPLLSAVEVFTLFWGSAWNQPPQQGLVSQLNNFFDFILTSALIDQLGEYSSGPYTITHGRLAGSATITAGGSPPRSLSDAALQAFLQRQITSGSAPKATPNTVYFIYVPPGVRVVMGGSASCQAFCGYHNAIDGKTFYAVMPYPACTGCTGGLGAFDALTSTSSHELCEAITDPIPGQGWYDDTHGEIGDICAWQTKKIGQYVVQLEWSNHASHCV